ncbi:MAG: GMP synthase [Ferruginibacter sp.]|jgi:GMP synthase-like glutamine amidotransferase
MSAFGKKTVKVAILDLYAGVANQGMRCLREILNQFGEMNNLDLQWDEFEVRLENQVPGLDYDIYISSGGPGSPLESEGSAWENAYFDWISDVSRYNALESNVQKKQVFFICHSFQLACRYFKLAEVTQRKSTAFGVFPVHYVSDAREEPVFEGLRDPFYAVDSRDFQVIQPRHNRLRELGASILAIEKSRPHVPYERAIMALRFNDHMIGTQFHPEADAVGMSLYLQTEEKKKTVIENHGYEKWESMIGHLNDPDKIMYTYARVLPNFLQHSINRLVPVEV